MKDAMCSLIFGGTRPVSTLKQFTIQVWYGDFCNGGIGKVTMARGFFDGCVGKVTVTRDFFDGGIGKVTVPLLPLSSQKFIEESITIAVLSFQWGFFEKMSDRSKSWI